MQHRVARAVSNGVVAAGTAGAIATACWLLNRFLDGSEHKRIATAAACRGLDETTEDDGRYDGGESFALLPVVSESDNEDEDEGAVGYTRDYFTPRYDVCMLAVSVQTQVDSLSDVSSGHSSGCRLCRAAAPVESCDPTVDLDEKVRTLSFYETDSSSDGSVLSIASDEDEDLEGRRARARACSRTEQWLYVRL
ncbi:unnamed protein product [Phytophthora fragariaefolia]|uniref:Unnamed protein product n=1 Tax=Phytophthora fragariaefolia TaxID=1490495 RepID=A0A9W6X0K5_9STRA|nr:unnamed protein product [Phytophthora fragariaefolia]